MTTIYIISFFFIIFTLNFGAVKGGEGQQALLKTLFEKYNNLERPIANDSARILIQMQFYLRQVMDINEKNQILRSSIWLNLIWKDDRLVWTPADYRNVSKIVVPYSKIWAPDILLWNSATQEFDATFKSNVELQYDGIVSWLPPALFRSTCAIDITWFPFDLQACTLKFSSWTYEYRRVDLEAINEKVDTSNYQRNGEWDLEDAFCQRNLVTYDCCPNDAWVDITVTIKLRRRALYYMFNIIIPSVIISCIGLLTFALPCESGEKVTMSVTILLSLAFFMTMVAETLPSTSEAIPFLGIYFGSLMLLCAISLVVTVFVGSVHHRKPTISPVPKWIHVWFSCRFAVFFRMLPPDHPMIIDNPAFPLHKDSESDIDVPVTSLRFEPNFQNLNNNNCNHCYRHHSPKDMKPVTVLQEDRSPIVSPVNWSKTFNSVPQMLEHTTNQLVPMPNNRNYNYSNPQLSKHGQQPPMTLLIEDANEILSSLKFINASIAETSRLESIRREWRLAAAVIDRIFMYISIALFLVFNLLMAVLAPNTPLSFINIY